VLRHTLFALCLACGSPAPADTVDSCAPADFVAANQVDWTFAVSPRCLQIKAGQTVTWNGSFTTHPLLADEGDTPNPISTADTSGPSATVTFPTAGTFGFKCEVHASMTGAVLVTP
jgi:plastocyanin